MCLFDQHGNLISSASRDFPNNKWKETYPFVVKPDNGQGSEKVMIIRDRKELLQVQNLCGYVIQEYVGEPEYTVDCFTDELGNLSLCAKIKKVSG